MERAREGRTGACPILSMEREREGCTGACPILSVESLLTMITGVGGRYLLVFGSPDEIFNDGIRINTVVQVYSKQFVFPK
jgi:hypothetical protein